MIANLMKTTAAFRSNLLHGIHSSNNNVRCYGIYNSLRINLRSQSVWNTVKVPTPKFVRSIAEPSVIRINTNVLNNVILWKYECPKYFRNVQIFGVVQFIILMSFSYVSFMFLPLRKHDTTWKDYAKLVYLPASVCFFTALAAVSTSWLVWFFVCRSLKYIILNKGGLAATLVTYHPIKGTTSRVVPLENFLVKKDRNDTGVFISLGVKGTRLFYLIDKEGTFVNPDLYDQTVALDRTPKNKNKK